jgi:hypothetical protein
LTFWALTMAQAEALLAAVNGGRTRRATDRGPEGPTHIGASSGVPRLVP